ncbi:DNA repair protein RAD50, partial [Tremellales sp. Uapishka_1]
MVQPSFSTPSSSKAGPSTSPTAPLDIFLDNQNQAYYEELYKSEAVCLCILRLLPPVCRHIVLHVLWSHQSLRTTELKALCQMNPQATMEETERVIQPALSRKIFLPIKLHQNKMQYPMSDTFKKGLRNALTGMGISNAFGVPYDRGPEDTVKPAEELVEYGEETWESILKYMVSSGLGERMGGVSKPKNQVLYLLHVSGLMADPLDHTGSNPNYERLTITSKGFQFLLEDRQAQLWQILMFYLTAMDAREQRSAEVLSLFFSLGCMELGQDYSASKSFPYAQATLGDLELYGFVHKRKKVDGGKADQFFPTHLATSLCAGDASSQNQDADEKRFLIMETNYKIYAYTSNELEIAILNLFVDIRIRYPNLVVGKLDRRCVKAAMEKGISAHQIIAYLSSHAHPQMYLSAKNRSADESTHQCQLGHCYPPWELSWTLLEVIEFYSPLTVIVGHNGSGKTTIIECLKYVTTGDLPPNTKGGAFVHDPKMANEKEVKAQVRLRFWNVNRQRMTATRSLQVTVKKTGGLTMKTLEGLLAKTEEGGADGKRNTISTKCSEMDEEVPLLLGVSKAILENVIFCHQEESNWPLSEPAALKKKFDDIFEATKYTKALDNIKSLRKERTAELKVDRERLKAMKTDKDRAEKMRKEIQEYTTRIEQKTTEAERYKEDSERLKRLNMEHYNQATEFSTTFERHGTLQKERDMYEANSKQLLTGLVVLSDSTEEIQSKINNFGAHVEEIKVKRNKQIEMKEKEDSSLEDLRRKERNLATVQGGLTANKRHYERNLKEREAAVREAAQTHNFAGYDYSPLEEAKIVDFVDKLHELVRRADSDLKRLQAEGARKERELQAELDRLSSTKTTAIATKKSKNDQIVALNSRVRVAESNFDSVTSVDADISIVENQISDAQGQLDRLDQELSEARYDEQIRERSTTIRQKETDRDKINSELSALNRQADSRAQLSIKRNELQTKKASIEATVSSHSARFVELVGEELNANSMEEKVIMAAGRKDRELLDAETAASAFNRNLSQIQTSVNISKQSLKDKKFEVQRLEQEIRDALEGVEDASTIAEAIENTTKDLEEAQKDLGISEGMVEYWNKHLNVGRNKHICAGCNRGLEDDEMPNFESYVANMIHKASTSDRKRIEQEIEQYSSYLAEFNKLASSPGIISNLKTKTIPDLEKQVKEELTKLDQLQQDVESAKDKVQTAKNASRDLQTLKGAASNLSRVLGEVQDLKSDIERLERDLHSSGSLKTVEEVQREVDLVNTDIKNLQREQSTLSSDKELKTNNLRSVSDGISRKTLRLGELKNIRQRRREAEANLKEMRDSLGQLQADLKDLDAAAQAAEAPWRERNEALSRYRNERQNNENEASLQVGIYQSSLSELESKHRACQQYILEGNDRKIRENENQVDSIKREISLSSDARQTIEATISSLSEDISRATTQKSNLKNNLQYRESLELIKNVQNELESIDIERAMKARKEFNTVYKAKMQEETEVQSKWQLRSGELLQMHEARKKMEETLRADYKSIDKLYKEQLIKTKTSEFANNDLEKYGKALDNAILKYHAIKMDEINDTIGHLWNKTYQGTDIDGIRIVSDHDEAGTTTTRKSYNYRVVMIKNEVELDMRGRCSAGQKVLASIIIRLALAESFGQGCGVLALDEPTTNLDQENINALAEALAEIIRERRRQANFQLIVITHDEGFLQRLAGHDVLEYYWRVSRDASQKSVLERQLIGV